MLFCSVFSGRKDSNVLALQGGSYLDPYTYFRRWKVTYNADGVATHCSFQVRKDGANYENIPLPLCDNSTPALRLFATIFDLPYRHNLKRKELLENLDPILSRMTQRWW